MVAVWAVTDSCCCQYGSGLVPVGGLGIFTHSSGKQFHCTTGYSEICLHGGAAGHAGGLQAQLPLWANEGAGSRAGLFWFSGWPDIHAETIINSMYLW